MIWLPDLGDAEARPAVLASLECTLHRLLCLLGGRPSESKPGFEQDPQEICIHIQVLEAQGLEENTVKGDKLQFFVV